MRPNSAAMNAFTKVVKVTNHTGWWDIELPDTLWLLLARFTSIASESIVLGLPDLAWSLRLFQSEKNFLNQLVTVLQSAAPSPFTQQMFLIAFAVQTCKA